MKSNRVDTLTIIAVILIILFLVTIALITTIVFLEAGYIALIIPPFIIAMCALLLSGSGGGPDGY